VKWGEAASPVCLNWRSGLKKAPRLIAQEIANGLGKVEGIARVEVAGGGYLNAYFDRGEFWEGVQEEQSGESRVASRELKKNKEKGQRRDTEGTEVRREGQGAGRSEERGR